MNQQQMIEQYVQENNTQRHIIRDLRDQVRRLREALNAEDEWDDCVCNLCEYTGPVDECDCRRCERFNALLAETAPEEAKA